MLYLIAFGVSTLICGLILLIHYVYDNPVGDRYHNGKQNIHDTPTPRIGSLAVILGITASFIFLYVEQNISFYIVFLVCTLPIFIGGLLEDITGKISPNIRLLLSFVSAAAAWLFLDIKMLRTSVEIIDIWLNNWSLLSFIITILLVGGLTHATNIVDGLNGLMLFFVMIAMASMSAISYTLGDIFLFQISMVIILSTMGLFIFNFPNGKIFAGDGGAYLMGFLVAEVSLLLVNRHPEVSPWFPVLLVIYPISELFFSIYRKKFITKISPSKSDSMHLHTIIYRRLSSRWSKNKKIRNFLASIFLWHFAVLTAIPALILWQHSVSLFICTIIFLTYYVCVYFYVVRSYSKFIKK